MDVAVQWFRGAKFSDVLKKTNLYEGSVIRGLRRLHELFQQLHSCFKMLGNEDMADKVKVALDGIKHGVAFTASLYL